MPQDAVDNVIQYQLAKLGVIAAELSHAVELNEQMGAACMDCFIGRLDEWRHGLPVSLQLLSLIPRGAGRLSGVQERAMLMVHILYLGAIVSLYRKLLVVADLERHSGQWTLAIAEREVAKYESACEMAALQIARILGAVEIGAYGTSDLRRSTRLRSVR